MSPSASRKSPMGRHGSRRSASPRRNSSSGRDRSPVHHKSSHRNSPPKRERHSSRPRSPKREISNPPVSRSPSPRTKRLRRAQAEREMEKASERDYDKSKHRERDADPRDRRERRSERQPIEEKSSRSRHGRSTSPSDRHRSRNRSQSPPHSNSRARAEDTKSTEGDGRDDASDSLARMKAAEEALEAKKEKPSFEYSGKLAEETNRVKGVTLLFNEPPDARKPTTRWRLYVFKAGEALNEPLYVHRQSCYLFGRERRVADIPTDHPSCSKQHAVLQYRQVEKEKPDGTMSKQIRPYIMDLGSTNKTFINDNPIDPQRYYELFEKDTIKFGNSSREYVLLHENSLS
ncbi:hypothetical protein V2J09_017317 [Rumex salicifolius]